MATSLFERDKFNVYGPLEVPQHRWDDDAELLYVYNDKPLDDYPFWYFVHGAPSPYNTEVRGYIMSVGFDPEANDPNWEEDVGYTIHTPSQMSLTPATRDWHNPAMRALKIYDNGHFGCWTDNDLRNILRGHSMIRVQDLCANPNPYWARWQCIHCNTIELVKYGMKPTMKCMVRPSNCEFQLVYAPNT